MTGFGPDESRERSQPVSAITPLRVRLLSPHKPPLCHAMSAGMPPMCHRCVSDCLRMSIECRVEVTRWLRNSHTLDTQFPTHRSRRVSHPIRLGYRYDAGPLRASVGFWRTRRPPSGRSVDAVNAPQHQFGSSQHGRWLPFSTTSLSAAKTTGRVPCASIVWLARAVKLVRPLTLRLQR